jgi:acyl transferase domain-containing protein
VTVQTACSTSLVAVVQACQALLTHQCDLALAGGCSIPLAVQEGYLYREGGILSPDGHCRAFDAEAAGTVPGSGAGAVVLKRLSEAVADGDTVHAVIRGAAVNNDGADKVGFTAPSVAGQAAVIAAAQAQAGADPATIGFVEAHGTGTPMGDPIEVAALTEVFGRRTQEPPLCALGSVKSNIGHLDAAAGVAGLIKAVLALQHAQIPPSLNFTTPNPALELDRSPFYVPTQLTPWPAQQRQPRRAGVSAFGLGGTNAHVVLEQAPARASSGPARPWQLLLLSAKTASALESATDLLAAYLQQHPDAALADVAFTLQTGRAALSHRRALLARSAADAAQALASRDPQRLVSHTQARHDRPVAFLLPGTGEHHPFMAAQLYQTEPTFRAHLDQCAELLRPLIDCDLRDLLYPSGPDAAPDLPVQRDLRALLGRGRFSFDEAVAGADRVTVAVTLFALLELYKTGEAAWEQEVPFGPITVRAERDPASGRDVAPGPHPEFRRAGAGA